MDSIQEKNYINAGYYSEVAEVCLLYLKENKQKAFKKLLSLENNIPLLNTSEYYEMEIMLELSLLYKDYEKAIKYLEILVDTYGYKTKDLCGYKNFNKLRRFNAYKTIKKKEKTFRPNTDVYKLLAKMIETDQLYRNFFSQKDSSSQCIIQYESKDRYMLDSIDAMHYTQIINIIRKFGYPLSKDIKYTRRQRDEVYVWVMTMTMHIRDSSNIEEMKSIILQNIKEGNCPPLIYASLVDRICLSERTPFIYGIYAGTLSNPSYIYDYEHLDDRRLSIGLPSTKIEQEIRYIKDKMFKNVSEK